MNRRKYGLVKQYFKILDLKCEPPNRWHPWADFLGTLNLDAGRERKICCIRIFSFFFISGVSNLKATSTAWQKVEENTRATISCVLNPPTIVELILHHIWKAVSMTLVSRHCPLCRAWQWGGEARLHNRTWTVCIDSDMCWHLTRYFSSFICRSITSGHSHTHTATDCSWNSRSNNLDSFSFYIECF